MNVASERVSISFNVLGESNLMRVHVDGQLAEQKPRNNLKLDAVLK